ncbi:HYC_CC_PP family protein [Psychroserpens mesophilus]|uniref:HYC_CC_PP family protein n=1 Tax=Psychroserpens mesophilus TaxID=325473 RepID=UPI003F498F60
MLKQFLHKTFSAFMAVLVLFSTVSFTVEKHFCGDVLIDAAVFTEAQKCKMEAFEKEQSKITKKHCCKDELEVVKGQDKLKRSQFEDITFEQHVFVFSFIYSYTNSLEELPNLIVPHKHYSPPILIDDIQVLDEVFLI